MSQCEERRTGNKIAKGHGPWAMGHETLDDTARSDQPGACKPRILSRWSCGTAEKWELGFPRPNDGERTDVLMRLSEPRAGPSGPLDNFPGPDNAALRRHGVRC
jgi:hypothetical protein